MYKLCTAVDTALCNQLAGEVDGSYILILKNQYTGYVQSTTMDILQHLYVAYGWITPSKLEGNDGIMKKDYNTTLTIEHLAE
eukprot:11178541-Ditylum_brightwellii.AAC.1